MALPSCPDHLHRIADRWLSDAMLSYLRDLNRGRLILWSYFFWYAVVVVRYFDSSPELWTTSLGLSAIIGFALYLSARTGKARARMDRWSIFRCF